MVPHLCVKLHNSAEFKPIRIDVPTVLGELQFGHTTSTYSGIGLGWRECFGKSVQQLCRELLQMRSPVALKFGSFVYDQPHLLLG